MPRGDGWDGFPVRGTYGEGVAWIVMILARALAYAHRMRTYHRDVKPANVLLTLQHGPQLLDFNLAESPHSASHAEAAMHGGTLPYMAPEHLEAFIKPDLWDRVGAKADIYSLGLVLRELLTGQSPDLPAQTLSPPRALRVLLDRRPMLDVSVRRANPAIPHALEAIVAKCLAVLPEARYSDAQALADDLNRFLRRLPLVGTTNPSRSERLGNWARRRRSALATNTFYLLVLVVAGWLLGVGDRVKQWLKPPVETLSGFLDAVAKTDDGEFKQAEAFLGDLAKEYPDSFLVKLYLSFALDEWKDQDKEPGATRDTDLSSKINPGASRDEELSLEDYRPKKELEADILLFQVMKAATKIPEVRARLTAWAQGHPKFASHLEASGLARFDRGGRFMQDTQERDYDRQRAENNRRVLYHLARPALELAVNLDPNSMVSPRLLAIILEEDKEFWRAYELISPAIDAHSVSDYDDQAADQLYKSRTVRARLATSLAELRRVDPRTDRQALKLMQQAVRDLEFSEDYIKTLRADEKTLAEKRVYLLANKVPAFLTLSEIEAEREMIPQAKKDYEIYLRTFDQIQEMRPKSLKYAHLWHSESYKERAEKLKLRLQGERIVSQDQQDPTQKPSPASLESPAVPHP